MNINLDCFQLPETCRTRYEQIRSQLDSLPLEEGIRTVKDFLRESPDHAEAHNDLGVLFYRDGNKLQTLGHYEKAVRLCPVNASFRKNLASFYFVEMGWTDDAIAIYTDILKSDPADTEVLTALGIISNALDRHEEAGIFFRRVIDLEPWNDEVRKELATLESPSAPCPERFPSVPIDSVEQPASASDVDDILASLRRQPSPPEDSPDERYSKALKLANDGFTEQAIDDLRRLLELDTDNALLHNDVAVLQTRRGDLTQALLHQEKAVALAPENSTFLKNLADLYYSSENRIDDAVTLYTRLLRENSEDTETLGALAIISMENNRPDEAVIFLNRIIELEPGNMDARRLLDQVRPGHGNDFFFAAG